MPFNPLTQVTCLHGVWAEDPSWVNPGDGNPVSSWRNQSGGGDPANVLTMRPTFRASTAAFNNKATIQFVSASSQYLDVNVTDVAQSFKLLAVFQAAAGEANRIIGRGTTASAHGLGVLAGNVFRVHYGMNLDGGTNDGNPHILRATVNGATSELWLDGVSIASGNASTGTHDRFTLGAGTADALTFAAFLNGHIAFAAIYTGATSDASLTTLANDLDAHYFGAAAVQRALAASGSFPASGTLAAPS